MTKGRPRIAPEILERSGAYAINPSRKNHEAPRANGKHPEKPDYFDDDESQMWMQLCSDLDEMGVMSTDNRELMIAYCCAFGGWIKAKRMVAKLGQVIVSKKTDGTVVTRRNPFSVELHKYREEMNRLLPEFGLTPSSRSRLKSVKTEEEDPFQEWLKRATG